MLFFRTPPVRDWAEMIAHIFTLNVQTCYNTCMLLQDTGAHPFEFPISMPSIRELIFN